MRPNLDPESELKPEYLPPDAKLEAGYIRYIRILPTEEPHGASLDTIGISSITTGDTDFTATVAGRYALHEQARTKSSLDYSLYILDDVKVR
jgi:hypothetical protein